MQSFSLCAHNVYYIRKINYLYIGKYYESKILIISINIGIRLKSLLHDIMIFLFNVYTVIQLVQSIQGNTQLFSGEADCTGRPPDIHIASSLVIHIASSGHPHKLSDQFTQNQRRLIAFSNQCLLYYQMRKQN